MSLKSAIEWTDATWNPVSGCDKVSPGCAHCYAETFAERFRGVPGHHFEQGFDLRLWPERLALPLRWQQPLRVFVNSMSDLFHPQVPDAFVHQVFDVMREAKRHTFQVLTKRPERAMAMSKDIEWTTNVWLGVSIENQRFVSRADQLRATDAKLKFLSCEPLLGPLDLDLSAIDWVIAGGESGHGARPVQADWIRGIRGQCLSAGVPFFFKQWGAFDIDGRKVGKKRAGRTLDGDTWDEMPAKRTGS